MPTIKEIKAQLKILGITSGLSRKRKAELLDILATAQKRSTRKASVIKRSRNKKSRRVRKKSRSRSTKKKTRSRKSSNKSKTTGGAPLNPIHYRLSLVTDKRSKCSFCKKRIRGAKPTDPKNPCNIVKNPKNKSLVSYENSWPQNYVTTGETDSNGKWKKGAPMFAMPKMQRYEYNPFSALHKGYDDFSWKNYHINCLFKSFGLEIPAPFSEKKAKRTRCSTHVIQSPVDFEVVSQNYKVPEKIKTRVKQLAVENHIFREKKCKSKSWNRSTRAYD